MPDPAAQLQQLYVAGFELQTFERFPKAVGIIRGQCIALVEATPQGLRLIGTPGWRMGGAAGASLGVLVERDGMKVFQAKQEVVEATPERLAQLEQFRADLQKALKPA